MHVLIFVVVLPVHRRAVLKGCIAVCLCTSRAVNRFSSRGDPIRPPRSTEGYSPASVGKVYVPGRYDSAGEVQEAKELSLRTPPAVRRARERKRPSVTILWLDTYSDLQVEWHHTIHAERIGHEILH